MFLELIFLSLQLFVFLSASLLLFVFVEENMSSTIQLPVDPAVISVILPPIGSDAAARSTDGGATSDGGTSGGEQSKSPSKKKNRRQRRSRSRANSDISASDVQAAIQPQPEQRPPKRTSTRARRSSVGSSVSSPEVGTTQQQPQQQQPQQAGERRNQRGSRRRRGGSQSSKGAQILPIPPILQNLFVQQKLQQQHSSNGNSPSPRGRARVRHNSTPPHDGRMTSLVGAGRPRADSSALTFSEAHRRLDVSSDNLSNFPRGRGSNRSRMFFGAGRPGFEARENNLVDPSFNKPGQSNEFVSREILDYYLRHRQTTPRYNAKQLMRGAFEKILVAAYPNQGKFLVSICLLVFYNFTFLAVNVHLVGSAINGVGDNSSTVDICVLARPKFASATSPTYTYPRRASGVSITNSLVSGTSNADQANGGTSESEQQVVAEATSSEPAKEAASPAKEESSAESPEDKTEATPKESPSRKKKDKKKKATVDSSSLVAEATAEKEEAKAKKEDDKPKDEATEKVVATEVVEIAAADSNVPSTTPEQHAVSSSEDHLTLESVEKLLHTKAFALNIKLITARVPIIKLHDKINKLNVTLNLNQEVSIRNTILIRDYVKMDWRLAPLVMVLKQWAKENHINSGVDKSISNYSWTLMVVHYLQVVEPPVLPCLQKLNPRRYDPRQPIDQAVQAWRKPPPKWRSNNNSNLRSLLRSMLHYYAYAFHYDQDVISIREGQAIRKDVVIAMSRDVPSRMQWNSFLCLEEPFSRHNTTRSVHDKEVFDHVIELLRMACTALKGFRTSLFNIIADDINNPITY